MDFLECQKGILERMINEQIKILAHTVEFCVGA